MKSIIYTCDSCGKEHPEEDFDKIITLMSSRRDSHLDIYYDHDKIEILKDYSELHFCNAKCIGDFVEQLIEAKQKEEEEII